MPFHPSDDAGPLRRVIGRTDHVTFRPNRLAFLDHARALPGGAPLLLVTLADARHYNEILRALGHQFAEDFVRAGVAGLAGLLPADLPLFHVSVLSFAVIPATMDGAEALAADIVRRFAAPLECSGLPVITKVGVGIAELDPDLHSASETLRAALSAAQHSRSLSRGWAHYDRRSDEAHQRAFGLLQDLRGALEEEGQLSLVFQPRLAMDTLRCGAAEVLLRWTHPRLGAISPAEFIPLAEATALMGPLTHWVLDAALRQEAEWRRAGRRLRLSVNVSQNNLREPDFVERLSATMHRHGSDPGSLEVELTEGAMASGDAQAVDSLAALRDAGVTLAIDDFGTGYSNMQYLTRLPAQVLKLDRSFVQPLGKDERQTRLARSIVALAHGLGYSVVAEGIETEEARELLAGWGCEEGQGYLFSRPLPPKVFAEWLEAVGAREGAASAAGPGHAAPVAILNGT
jgi:EAL domain-containing protein (putative c-di-GMP-specific phosphodiesterase class I)/GGDEF domain-containing protein